MTPVVANVGMVGVEVRVTSIPLSVVTKVTGVGVAVAMEARAALNSLWICARFLKSRVGPR